MIKNIIFDWSGVIKDAFDAHVWVVNKMLETWGSEKRFTYDELKENWEQPYMNFWTNVTLAYHWKKNKGFIMK